MPTQGPHVAVIGGGVIGLSLAYQLAADGAAVTLLDRRPTGQGASAVNAGWVCPAEATPVPAPGMVSQALRWMLRSDSPLYIRPSLDPTFVAFMLRMWRYCNAADFRAGADALLRLSEGAMAALDAWAEDGVDFEMHAAGLLVAFRSAARLDQRRRSLAAAEAAGLEPRVLVGDAVREQEPMLLDEVAGGIHYPHERHLDPVSLTAGLRRRCAALGVTVVDDDAVIAVERRGRRVVAAQGARRRWEADAFVLAAGAWSGPLARHFGTTLPVRPGTGYSVDLPALGLRSPVYLTEAKVAVTPLDAGLRLSGTMEFAGYGETVDPVRAGAIRDAPGGYFRDWAPPADATTGAGMRPMTPDGLPVIGRLGTWENAYVSSGHAMLGLTLAPTSALALSRLILRGESSPVLEPFRSDRFGGLLRRGRRPGRPRDAAQ
jgi:D-amino-acid dehydrogenase